MIRISSKYFVAGLETNAFGVAIRCAPIIKYMKGWSSHRVAMYCNKKGWKFEVIEDARSSI